MPSADAKPCVKRDENDTVDVVAICEAVMQPSMRFAPTKVIDQQSALTPRRARALLIRQRTTLVNALCAHIVRRRP